MTAGDRCGERPVHPASIVLTDQVTDTSKLSVTRDFANLVGRIVRPHVRALVPWCAGTVRCDRGYAATAFWAVGAVTQVPSAQRKLHLWIAARLCVATHGLAVRVGVAVYFIWMRC